MERKLDPKIAEKFNRIETKARWFNGGLVITMLVFLIFSLVGDSAGGFVFIFGAILITVFVTLVIQANRNWRCPSCKKELGVQLEIAYCPHCGIRLREGEDKRIQ